ncbi:Gfo/Idh/MocA family protein [Geobacter sp. DSM 9736]|uniref:Gfo/Idh/MocA family protein n=1 Tax=Geobacter sp. DSM 9736 TaxID=1277350 RepID=UPI000B5136F2|nr:Gfo/Idh/MocA family oxidoreductase [Geobacter sp. DSM 9736]SNB45014.1 Predicted dehydrogenase [Geobacter sp. DSM 9736]
MKRIRTAVIGVGYLGRFHAQKYAAIEHSDLVAVVDLDPQQGGRVAEEVGTRYCGDYREIADQVDAVSIVVPTNYHHEVAKFFLERGKHVLLEKPITRTLEEADELIRIAAAKGAVFQVGHLERFNPAMAALGGVLKEPRFIDATRIGPFKARGTDVNIVLDLMIHDIEIIQHLVGSNVARIDAVGAPVFTAGEDIANARIVFENGCVANVTASRVSFTSERKMRIFQPDSYVVLDFQNRKLAVLRKGDGESAPGVPAVDVSEQSFEQVDALRLEIEAFLESIATGKAPVVTGEDGRKALEIALLINKQL